MATRGPKPKVSDAELVDAVGDTQRPFATANDIAEAVDLSPFRVRERMESLDGEIEIATVGNAKIYWSKGSFSSDSK